MSRATTKAKADTKEVKLRRCGEDERANKESPMFAVSKREPGQEKGCKQSMPSDK